MQNQPLKVAVIGVGYLGRFHAEKLAALKNVKLVAVADTNLVQAKEVARSVRTAAVADYTTVLNDIDAGIVVTPTISHWEVASTLLSAGKDVFCEKPLSATLAEADHLIKLAREKQRILQVGHLERFNPAVEGLLARASRPMFLEVNRIAPFKARALDVDVALDLMIHDIDIILALVGEQPKEIRAVGVPVLGSHADIVNARLEFPGGCVANLTASRLALKDERKMRLFQPDAYMSLDFRKRKLLVVNSVEFRPGHSPKVKAERPRFGRTDPMEEELKSFVACVASRAVPRVDGVQGRAALACALAVQAKVNESLAGQEGLLAESRGLVEAVGHE